MIRVNHGGGGVDAPPPSSSNSRVKTFRIIYQLLNMVNPKIKSCLNSWFETIPGRLGSARVGSARVGSARVGPRVKIKLTQPS